MRNKIKNMNNVLKLLLLAVIFFSVSTVIAETDNKPRVIVTSDGEVDDECSLVRFLLYANDWEVEGIITSSSQYHWRGHKWAGDDWLVPYLEAYTSVYPNLLLHDSNYPSPDKLKSVTFLGNVDNKGEMDSITPGSEHIVKVLLDETDDRPIWLQAWGGTNTIARALKTIEEDYPDKMEYVANKIRFFFIWEQDNTYQKYIRVHWGKYNILTIISDQFWAIAYQWDKIMPEDKIDFFKADWMRSNILKGHGALCSLYQAYQGGSDNEGWRAGNPKQKGSFRSEGDSPAFLHTINTGLGNLELPSFGGWGGRYVKVRENTWLDPVVVPNYQYPKGRWFTRTAWGRMYMREEYPKNQKHMKAYFKPLTRWADAIQNDFAARADWCVMAFENANHQPVVKLNHKLNLSAKQGGKVKLNAKQSYDPDGNDLTFKWWYYKEVSSYKGVIEISNSNASSTSFTVPKDVVKGTTIHLICEVSDNGTPKLTRYKRVVVTVDE